MAYEDNCAACTYLNECLWCEKKGEPHSGSDRKCNSFCEAYSRSYYDRKNLYESSPSSGGCYLTTIMCTLLEYPDDNYYLRTLRNFRNNVMQPNPNYIPLLLTYDIVGPVIAKKLASDPTGKMIAATFFNHFITPAITAIEEGKYEHAITIYTAMTDGLAKRYNINTNIANINISNIDTTQLGHGKIRKLIPEK